jgi:ankyrin repeat protein
VQYCSCQQKLTPFLLRIRFKDGQVAEYLISKGANIHHRNNTGETVLHWAAASGHQPFLDVIHATGDANWKVQFFPAEPSPTR